MPERTAPPDREKLPILPPDQRHAPDPAELAGLPPGRSWALAPLAIPQPTPRWTRETVAEAAPGLVAALFDEGVRRERARLQAIDALAIVGHADLVRRARYEAPITAEALAVEILKAELGRGAGRQQPERQRPPEQPERQRSAALPRRIDPRRRC